MLVHNRWDAVSNTVGRGVKIKAWCELSYTYPGYFEFGWSYNSIFDIKQLIRGQILQEIGLTT